MTNIQLQEMLKKYPNEMEVMLHIGSEKLKSFDSENICDHAEDDRIIEKTGNLHKGSGQRMIVINPPIY